MSFFSYAQTYKAIYNMSYKEDSLSKDYSQKEMILEYTKDKSVFYSYEKFKYDSLVARNEKPPITNQAGFDYDFMVVKQKLNIEKYTILLNNLYRISYNIKLDWNITKDKIKIGNYNCQKAILNYKGRTWEAWFTNDIPIFDGPYIFSGLPGLIVQMNDKRKDYIFSLIGLKKSEDSYALNELKIKPIPVNEKQLRKVMLDHYNDPFREMKTSNSKSRWLDENGKEFTPDFNELTKNEQESIKKYNNPIELSDAIQYPK